MDFPLSTRSPCAWGQGYCIASLTQRECYTFRRAFHERAALGVVMTDETMNVLCSRFFSSRFIEFKKVSLTHSFLEMQTLKTKYLSFLPFH